MVDLELYKIFKIVAEEENITEASRRLNISQPAVTKHIHNLEDVLGVNLFERTNRGLKLTEVGTKIYNDIINPINILESVYGKYGKSKIINLGIHSTMLNKLFGKKLSEFYSKYEDVKVIITNNDTQDMIKKLEKGELDIVISKKTNDYNKDKLNYIQLGILNDILVSGRDSNLENKVIDMEYIKSNIIYLPRKTSSSTINFFESINCKEEELKVKNISYNTMVEIIENSNNIGLVTKEYMQKELNEKDIIELKTEFNIKPLEYGIYINNEIKFKELLELIEILK